jgi:hypothetical protein
VKEKNKYLLDSVETKADVDKIVVPSTDDEEEKSKNHQYHHGVYLALSQLIEITNVCFLADQSK